MTKEKIVVALSGGVDSAVSVHLLQEQGYEVYGYTFLTCGSEEDRETVANDAKKVANFFHIPHTVADIRNEFENTVKAYFVRQYAAGLTPNPCVFCNQIMKFPKLMAYADSLGIEKVATGHYARIENGLLKKGIDKKKDQSYFLCLLTGEDLSRIVFPLGAYEKTEVREIASAIGLPVAKKSDSQEICFIPNDDYRAVIKQYPWQYHEGKFLDKEGNVLGTHQGLPFYTIGQRRGIGIAFGTPKYVVGLDAEKNAVYIGDEEELLSEELMISFVNYQVAEKKNDAFRGEVKIRYLSPPVPATITPCSGNRAKICFDKPQKSITPGQFAVFYDGETLLGGGTIL